jgi:hypothetical protein
VVHWEAARQEVLNLRAASRRLSLHPPLLHPPSLYRVSLYRAPPH